MKHVDIIYGNVEIIDNVVVDIINTAIFQRLKGIDQAGYFQVYFPGTEHSRFDHSVGCYLLLRKFGASIEEQIAGLLHDISHSAFSHTADYVFDGGRGADHNYQDDIFEEFVMQTEIPGILQKYGFDVDYILNENNFSLQETDLPDLCADRIDYSLRGVIVYDIASKAEIDSMLDNLKVVKNKWVFENFDYAQKYAQMFKELNDVYYSNRETAAMFSRTSNWIKYAIDKGYITQRELFMTDNEVIKKINAHKKYDKTLDELWEKMNNPKIILGKSEDDDTREVVVKSRIVDPLFIDGSNMKRVSDRDHGWSEIVREDMQPKIYYLKQ